MDYLSSARDEVVSAVSGSLNGVVLDSHIKNRPDGDFLIFELARPGARFFKIINEVNDSLSNDHPFKDRISLQERKKKPQDVFGMPEIVLLRRELTQSLTVHRNSFKDDFFNRYTPSVSNYEGDVVGQANFVVYGRRGAGKSSLLAYVMHNLVAASKPFVWVAMQGYSARDDVQAICSVIAEILSQFGRFGGCSSGEIEGLQKTLQDLGEDESSADVEKKLTRLIPRLRSVLGEVSTPEQPVTIFLDDLHLVDVGLQPKLLGKIYALARDNNIFIKVSGIEALTRTWDGVSSTGMQAPHDIQELRLDHNLTMPDRSKEHIKDILDSHAIYCGIPGVSYIADDKAISRLVLAAAAVPRDALSLFAQAIGKSALRRQKSVSITSINAAASENIEGKLRDLEQDLFDEKNEVKGLLDRVKDFCISEQKKNAFLVKIQNSDHGYVLIQKLTALRFAHVLHEGTTPHKAGERYIALMLDFGFYVGIRAARSVNLFLDEPRPLLAKDIRVLPIFKP